MLHKYHNHTLKPCLGFAALFLLASTLQTFAAHTIQLAWDPSNDPQVAGYNLSYGTSSHNYTQTINAGSSTSASVSLGPDATYYFVVTAYNSAGLQSVPSNEVSLIVGPNIPPTVTLTSPQANASFGPSASIGLTATAADADGTITKVEFYEDSNKIGVATAAPYAATWNNAPAGSFVLTALAYDDSGAAVRSTGVPIQVAGIGPTPSPTPAPTATPAASKKIIICAVSRRVAAGNPAQFRISVAQNQGTTTPTVVNYSLGGTAQGGVDYSTAGLNGQITIPAGARTATLGLNTLNTPGIKGKKSAVATVLPGTDNYPGMKAAATVWILDH
jgi:hypothetical protein